MKKIIVALLLSVTATSALAHDGFRGSQWGYRGGYYGGRHDDFGRFVAPALIGGLIGYGLAQPRYAPPVSVYQAPMVYSPPVVYSAPNGYHYESLLDANCNCYRTVLISN